VARWVPQTGAAEAGAWPTARYGMTRARAAISPERGRPGLRDEITASPRNIGGVGSESAPGSWECASRKVLSRVSSALTKWRSRVPVTCGSTAESPLCNGPLSALTGVTGGDIAGLKKVLSQWSNAKSRSGRAKESNGRTAPKLIAVGRPGDS
jgi:hypothetical protein